VVKKTFQKRFSGHAPTVQAFLGIKPVLKVINSGIAFGVWHKNES
jgi:hypothetical protein